MARKTEMRTPHQAVWLRRLAATALVSFLVCSSPPAPPPVAAANTTAPAGLVRGARLYQQHCLRCHGDFAGNDLVDERIEDRDLLKKSIEKDGCGQTWASRYGGPLSDDELSAVADALWLWHRDQAQLVLPPLDPLPETSEEPPAWAASKKSPKGYVLAEDKKDVLPPPLAEVTATNPVARGAWLFTTNCHRCHLGYQTARMGRGVAVESVRNTIANGKTSTQMQGFSIMRGGSLTNADIEAIVAYIVAWEQLDAPPAVAAQLLVPPAVNPDDLAPVGLPRFNPVHGDPINGERLFSRNCFSCHGRQGRGLLGPPLDRGWPVTRADLYAKSVLKQGVPGSPMRGWAQDSGGPLTAAEIDDLVALLGRWDGQ